MHMYGAERTRERHRGSIECNAIDAMLRSDEDFGLSRLYESREVEYSLEDYLRACSDDPSFYAGAAGAC